jgi:hypothetical protein
MLKYNEKLKQQSYINELRRQLEERAYSAKSLL